MNTEFARTIASEVQLFQSIKCDRFAVGWVEVRNPKSSGVLWFRSDRFLGNGCNSDRFDQWVFVTIPLSKRLTFYGRGSLLCLGSLDPHVKFCNKFLSCSPVGWYSFIRVGQAKRFGGESAPLGVLATYISERVLHIVRPLG